MSVPGSVYCVGNGVTAAYFERGRIMQLFGSPYSSPSVLHTSFDGCDFPNPSSFEAEAPVWRTGIYSGEREIGEETVFALPDSGCVIQRMSCRSEVKMSIHIGEGLNAGIFPVIDSSSLYDAQAAFTIVTRAGNYIYSHLPLAFEQFYGILLSGGVSATLDAANSRIDVVFSSGESVVRYVSGRDYGDLEANIAHALGICCEEALSFTRERYRAVLAGCEAVSALHEDAPRYDEAKKALTGTVFNLKAQQSVEGGVLAGHFYHLGYVRDQFGDARGMLALGLFDEVKSLLGFYRDTFSAFGKIKNAQGCGAPGIFHPAENDEVEITAYLIILARRYVELTGDARTAAGLWPMLEWAYGCLRRNLKDGMLPFNGDETYIAGGILPRDCINDGSAEGTMLFISACAALKWLNKRSPYLNREVTDDISASENEAKSKFSSNFIRPEGLITNNPAYRRLSEHEFAYGVCESYGAVGGCHGFSWMRRSADGIYLCPSCYAKGYRRRQEDNIYMIDTVSLMAMYMGSDVLDSGPMRDIVVRTAENKDFKRIVGYDFGLTLYDLTEIKHPLAAAYYDHALDAVDDCSSWSEYYNDRMPCGCRYRAWESAINAEGIVKYLRENGFIG